jgi:hypothetical protein
VCGVSRKEGSGKEPYALVGWGGAYDEFDSAGCWGRSWEGARGAIGGMLSGRHFGGGVEDSGLEVHVAHRRGRRHRWGCRLRKDRAVVVKTGQSQGSM